MTAFTFREIVDSDIPILAKIRSGDSQTFAFWQARISQYLDYTHNPQKALKPRIIYVATDQEMVVGFIAGHHTQRYECDGELQWIDVIEKYRGKRIGAELIRILAKWFIKNQCYKICVDPGDELARNFYIKNGAEKLNDHWLAWQDIRKIFV